jgi:hypothetical protein
MLTVSSIVNLVSKTLISAVNEPEQPKKNENAIVKDGQIVVQGPSENWKTSVKDDQACVESSLSGRTCLDLRAGELSGTNNSHRKFVMKAEGTSAYWNGLREFKEELESQMAYTYNSKDTMFVVNIKSAVHALAARIPLPNGKISFNSNVLGETSSTLWITEVTNNGTIKHLVEPKYGGFMFGYLFDSDSKVFTYLNHGAAPLKPGDEGYIGWVNIMKDNINKQRDAMGKYLNSLQVRSGVNPKWTEMSEQIKFLDNILWKMNAIFWITPDGITPLRATRQDAVADGPSLVEVIRNKDGISEIAVRYGQYENDDNHCAPGSAFIHNYGPGATSPNCTTEPIVYAMLKVDLKKGYISSEKGYAYLRNSGPDGHAAYQGTCLRLSMDVSTYVEQNRKKLSSGGLKDLEEASRLLLTESKKPYTPPKEQ